MKLITYIAIVLMLTCIVSTNAFAANSENVTSNNKAAEGLMKEVKNQEEEQNHVSLSGNNDTDGNGATVKLRETKEEYFTAKEKLQQINANISSGKINASSKEVFEVKQKYLLETINYTISNLEQLKEKVDESNTEDANAILADIDDSVSKLDAEKANVENAITSKELAESARTIRDIWKDAVKNAYRTRTMFVNDKVDIHLNNSVSLSERLSKEIKILLQQGKDTTELEELLQEYNGLIEQAQQNRERAREAYQNGDENAREYWSDSAEKLKEANSVLAEMSQILKTYRHGMISLNEDTLLAEGNGTAVLSGDIAAEMTIDDAQLVIKDLADDAKITIITDDSKVILQLDNSLADEPKRALVYSDLTGKVSISGGRLTVMVKGTNLDLEVEGTGSAILSGEGTYTVGNAAESKQWASQFEHVSEEDGSQEE